MAKKFTATLLRGLTYTFANIKFEAGVAKPVSAEIAETLRDKTVTVTLAETHEAEERHVFEIAEEGEDDAEGEGEGDGSETPAAGGRTRRR